MTDTDYYSRTDIEYEGGSNFTIPFSYISKNDIHVFVNENQIDTWEWLNDSQIQITSTLQSGDIISIRRITPIDEKIVTYQDMSMVLSQDNLNLSQDQVLNAVQELYDGFANLQSRTTFVYTQNVASDTWVIEHNLGRFPSVTIVDSAGTVFIPERQYIDNNTCIAKMIGAMTGTAYLN